MTQKERDKWLGKRERLRWHINWMMDMYVLPKCESKGFYSKGIISDLDFKNNKSVEGLLEEKMSRKIFSEHERKHSLLYLFWLEFIQLINNAMEYWRTK